MRIGIPAERAGFSTSSIRSYAARGLLPRPKRRPSGYREYDGRVLEIILFINRARSLSFSLVEIAAHIYSPKTTRENRGSFQDGEESQRVRRPAGRSTKPTRSRVRGNRRIAKKHERCINHVHANGCLGSRTTSGTHQLRTTSLSTGGNSAFCVRTDPE